VIQDDVLQALKSFKPFSTEQKIVEET
jgi:hypothetical protein